LFIAIESVLLTQFVLHDSVAWTDGTLSEAQCSDIAIEAEINCCPTKQASPTCFLCLSASDTLNADKELPGGISCGTLEAQLSYAPTAAICDGAKAGFEGFFNVESFCECTNSVAPDICKPCNDNQEVNPTAVVPDEDGFTCTAGAEFARHITNQTACAEDIETDEARAACCIDKAESGGMSSLSMNSFAALLLLVGVSFAI
jgi:hypothetical protein